MKYMKPRATHKQIYCSGQGAAVTATRALFRPSFASGLPLSGRPSLRWKNPPRPPPATATTPPKYPAMLGEHIVASSAAAELVVVPSASDTPSEVPAVVSAAAGENQGQHNIFRGHNNDIATESAHETANEKASWTRNHKQATATPPNCMASQE